MSKECNCEFARQNCPDPKQLVGGSQFPDMPCSVILEKMILMNKRIRDNNDASLISIPRQTPIIEKDINNVFAELKKTMSDNAFINFAAECPANDTECRICFFGAGLLHLACEHPDATINRI